MGTGRRLAAVVGNSLWSGLTATRGPYAAPSVHKSGLNAVGGVLSGLYICRDGEGGGGGGGGGGAFSNACAFICDIFF